ncbi:HAD family hydrolase [Martelella mediterranea]|uniref:HAD superfamily hydrolase (TIGR01493 family)/HAD superfamily hydrolase (TIGR01509 family)/HAD superfamily hydrolase (TIGR01549 family) n=1 Tax=Martelella mediterranea TaxID=293089 RepID=A0A4R3NXV9_9HYPH|nr:HAD family hydrolase [Martelella mediterranea]TCT44635.1 HAD superfamily hydrolase (TIGR01493 family)/HAD superfamily hydrolase (TIGR01509 family)/HAD superfamily hydrolase (TIGR01549 family) [Martelella mediterranea]
MTIKAVIFDMDGVLIDAKDWHYDALNRALGLFGFTIERYEHATAYDGLPTRTKLKRLSVEKKLPDYLHTFINEMKQRYTMEIIYERCRPRFEHEYALSRLRMEGYRLGVASNSMRDTVTLMMEKASLTAYLDFMLSNQDVKASKPDPEIYLTAIEKLGLKPTECLIVEDNQNGIKAARAAGGHLLVVKDVDEVTYDNIKQRIAEIEGAVKSAGSAA